MKTLFRLGLISLILLTIGACGFHLRNTASLPSALSPIYIGGPAGGGGFGTKLRYQLTNANTEVTQFSNQAAYQLLILSKDEDKRIISLDRRGLAAEYGLSMNVAFELRDRENHIVFGPQRISERRTITNDPDNALTTAQDIGIVSDDMDQVLAAQIVRRLGAYTTHNKLKKQTLPAQTGDNSAAPATAK